MGVFEVIEAPVSLTVASVVPGACAIMQVTIRALRLITWPMLELVFDKPILRAVLHVPDGDYSNWLFAQGRTLVRFSFAGPPFDTTHSVNMTVYSVEPVRVIRASVRSLHQGSGTL